MNSFIKSFLLFLVFCCCFYIIFICFWGEYATSNLKKNLFTRGASGHSFTRFAEAKVTNDIDVLFIGSSHAYRGFDTRIFEKNGIKAFNLGSSSQTPIQSNILLQRYLKNFNPKLVIYEVFPTTLSIDGVESALDIIVNDKNDWESFNMTMRFKHIKVLNTFLFSFYEDVLGKKSNYYEPKYQFHDRYIKGGYVDRELTFNNNHKHPATLWELNMNQKKVFEEIVEFFKNNNIQFMLVQAPVTNSLYASYENNEFIDNYFSSLGLYYNFNRLMALNDTLDFYDAHHLNKNGVQKFNNLLIEKLKN